MTTIRKAEPSDASALSQVAYAAKAHWGYPAAWMEAWAEMLTFTGEYFEAHESWAAVLDDKPVPFAHCWIKAE